jgi:hypothetical protein
MTSEASCFSSESNLLTQGDLEDLVRDFNLSNKRYKLLALTLVDFQLDAQISSIQRSGIL